MSNTRIRLQSILGSRRPVWAGEAIARWASDVASARSDFDVELIDLAQTNLPLLDERASHLWSTTGANTRAASRRRCAATRP